MHQNLVLHEQAPAQHAGRWRGHVGGGREHKKDTNRLDENQAILAKLYLKGGTGGWIVLGVVRL